MRCGARILHNRCNLALTNCLSTTSCVLPTPCTANKEEVPNKDDDTRICAAMNAELCVYCLFRFSPGLPPPPERLDGGRCMQNSALQQLRYQPSTCCVPSPTPASLQGPLSLSRPLHPLCKRYLGQRSGTTSPWLVAEPLEPTVQIDATVECSEKQHQTEVG